MLMAQYSEWSESHSVVSDSLRSHGLFSPWNSPGHNSMGILEWVALLFSRGPSQPRDWTQVSHIASRFFSSLATKEAQQYSNVNYKHNAVQQISRSYSSCMTGTSYPLNSNSSGSSPSPQQSPFYCLLVWIRLFYILHISILTKYLFVLLRLAYFI